MIEDNITRFEEAVWKDLRKVRVKFKMWGDYQGWKLRISSYHGTSSLLSLWFLWQCPCCGLVCFVRLAALASDNGQQMLVKPWPSLWLSVLYLCPARYYLHHLIPTCFLPLFSLYLSFPPSIPSLSHFPPPAPSLSSVTSRIHNGRNKPNPNWHLIRPHKPPEMVVTTQCTEGLGPSIWQDVSHARALWNSADHSSMELPHWSTAWTTYWSYCCWYSTVLCCVLYLKIAKFSMCPVELIQTPMGLKKVSILVRCLCFKVHARTVLGERNQGVLILWGVSSDREGFHCIYTFPVVSVLAFPFASCILFVTPITKNHNLRHVPTLYDGVL